MIMKTAKIGVVFLVSVMAFAAIGASLAHWEETLTITGEMTTDDIYPYFHCIESNDVDNWDPDGCGCWDPTNGWQGDRRDKDVGSCTVQMGETTNEMEIDIKDAYPCYYVHPKFCISNAGSCPVLIHGLKLTEVSIKKPGWSGPVKIPVNHDLSGALDDIWSFVDIYEKDGKWKAKIRQDVAHPEKFDFSLKLTGDLNIDTQLDPIDWVGTTNHVANPVTELDGDICIHFENGCEESTTYDFVIELVFYNWPHYVGTPPWTTGTSG